MFALEVGENIRAAFLVLSRNKFFSRDRGENEDPVSPSISALLAQGTLIFWVAALPQVKQEEWVLALYSYLSLS